MRSQQVRARAAGPAPLRSSLEHGRGRLRCVPSRGLRDQLVLQGFELEQHRAQLALDAVLAQAQLDGGLAHEGARGLRAAYRSSVSTWQRQSGATRLGSARAPQVHAHGLGAGVLLPAAHAPASRVASVEQQLRSGTSWRRLGCWRGSRVQRLRKEAPVLSRRSARSAGRFWPQPPLPARPPIHSACRSTSASACSRRRHLAARTRWRPCPCGNCTRSTSMPSAIRRSPSFVGRAVAGVVAVVGDQHALDAVRLERGQDVVREALDAVGCW